MNTATTRIRESRNETSVTGRLFRCAAALLLAFGCVASAQAAPPSKVQNEDVLLADALLLAQTHYCSAINHSTRAIEFTVGIWNETGGLMKSKSGNVEPGHQIVTFMAYPGTATNYCTVTFVGQKSEARASHCGFTEAPDTYELSALACLPLD